MTTTEIEKPTITTVNRTGEIEQALTNPNPETVDFAQTINDLRRSMVLVSKLGPDHAEKVLGITHDVMVDVVIARRRSTGKPTVLETVHRKKQHIADPIGYAISYAEKLSENLTNMSMNGNSKIAIVISEEIYTRINEYTRLRNLYEGNY